MVVNSFFVINADISVLTTSHFVFLITFFDSFDFCWSSRLQFQVMLRTRCWNLRFLMMSCLKLPHQRSCFLMFQPRYSIGLLFSADIFICFSVFPLKSFFYLFFVRLCVCFCEGSTCFFSFFPKHIWFLYYFCEIWIYWCMCCGNTALVYVCFVVVNSFLLLMQTFLF